MAIFYQEKHEAKPPIEIPAPSWITKYHNFESMALKRELAKLAETNDDLAAFEERYKLLEGYEGLRTAIVKNSASEIGAAQIYSRICQHFNGLANEGVLYEKVFNNVSVNLDEFETLVELNTGYWNSPIFYQTFFPNISLACGLESAAKNCKIFTEQIARFFEIDTEVFQIQLCNFAEELSEKNNDFIRKYLQGKKADLIFLEDFPFLKENRKDAENLLASVSASISDNGYLIFTSKDTAGESSNTLSSILINAGTPFQLGSRTIRTQLGESYVTIGAKAISHEELNEALAA